MLEVPEKLISLNQFIEELAQTNYLTECQFIAKVVQISLGNKHYITLGCPYAEEQPDRVLQLEVNARDLEYITDRQGQYVLVSSMYDSLVIHQFSLVNKFHLQNMQASLFTVDDDEICIAFTKGLPYTGISISFSFAPVRRLMMRSWALIKKLRPSPDFRANLSAQIAQRLRH